jgi:hypothetical protein
LTRDTCGNTLKIINTLGYADCMTMCVCNHSTWDAEVEGLRGSGQPGLHNENLSQKKKNCKQKFIITKQVNKNAYSMYSGKTIEVIQE